jgi:uncharacterized protein YjiS (DUF1127 family)
MPDETIVTPCAPAPATDAPLPPWWLAGFVKRLAAWVGRRRQRALLAELTDDQLRDIGLTRREADREASSWR